MEDAGAEDAARVDAGPPPPLSVAWSHVLVSTSPIHLGELHADAMDRSWLVGDFTGTMTTPASVVTARASGTDVFVHVLGADGAGMRGHYLGGVERDLGHAIDVDPTGRMLIAGGFEGANATFGAGALTSAGALDAFVGIFTTASDLGPAFAFGGTGSEQALDVAWAPGGSVAVVGTFEGTASFGGATLASAGGSDGFVVASADDGTVRWVRQIGGTGADRVEAVTLDASGNVYVTGAVRADADLGDGPTTGGAGDDLFVASFAAADGAHRWSYRFGSDALDAGYDAVIDAGGDVAVVGEAGDVDVGSGLTTPGAFLARWSTDGILQSERRFGAGRAHPRSIRRAAAGFVVAGVLDDGFLIGGLTFAPHGGRDVFVVRLGATGAPADGFVFGGAADEEAFGATELGDGTVVVAASFDGEATAVGDTVTSAGGAGAVVFAVRAD
jgi:hypothetical protein